MMRVQKRVLVVEDEPDLGDLISFNLERAGYAVSLARDGIAGLSMARSEPPDLAVLDIMLPGVDGLEVARAIRTDPKTAGIPILMLTAKSQETDQIAGLETGADDYMTKPFSVKLLLARIEALLRRCAPAGQEGRLRLGNIEADLNSHCINVEGTPVRFTLTEFRLLIALMRAKGKALTREDLMYRAIGPDITVTTRTIDVHIAAIRKKLREAGPKIRTVRGVGYLLDTDAELIADRDEDTVL